MSGKTITRYVLTCDGGCGTKRGAQGEYETAMDARASAYAIAKAAELQIGEAVSAAIAEHDITYAELLVILASSNGSGPPTCCAQSATLTIPSGRRTRNEQHLHDLLPLS